MKYRVILKISYHQAEFEFDDKDEAIQFATMAVKNAVQSEDGEAYVTLRIAETFDKD